MKFSQIFHKINKIMLIDKNIKTSYFHNGVLLFLTLVNYGTIQWLMIFLLKADAFQLPEYHNRIKNLFRSWDTAFQSYFYNMFSNFVITSEVTMATIVSEYDFFSPIIEGYLLIPNSSLALINLELWANFYCESY